MSKHRLSPAPLPPSKRTHTNGDSHAPTLPAATFEFLLYDELILCIFSHLSWVDLCVSQSVCRNWSRLAADNELWRFLYLRTFGRLRLRGARGFVGRADGREVRSLPGRVKSEDHKDWKWMFRISSNWRTGRCSVQHYGDSPLFKDTKPPPSTSSATPEDDGVHILLAGPLTIIASTKTQSSTSMIYLQSFSGTHHALPCPSTLQGPSSITSLCLDQSSPILGDLRLAAFLSTGEFTVFNVNHCHLHTSAAKLTYVPSRRQPARRVLHAVYHHPLLITLSQDFKLCIYDVSASNVVHTQTLSSFTSYPPASLVLSTPTSSTYKLIVSYAIPVYPHHWTVGATELMISGYEANVTRSSLLSPDPATSDPPLCVMSSRTIRSIDIPAGFVDERKMQALSEQWSRKVIGVADTQTDGKWVVVAPSDPSLPSSSDASSSSGASSPSSSADDSHWPIGAPMFSPATLQLYRLFLPSATSVASAQPKLSFVRNLYGQTGPVEALALADGRCVSLGANGSVWVWDLEAATGAEVCEPDPLSYDRTCESLAKLTRKSKRALVFDERRVVTAGVDGLVIRRFDV